MGAPIKIMANGHAEKFQFQLEGDETTFAVPYLGDMSAADIYGMLDAVSGEHANEFLRWALGKFREWCPDAVERMSLQQFGYLVGAWASAGDDAQGVGVGESEASPS